MTKSKKSNFKGRSFAHDSKPKDQRIAESIAATEMRLFSTYDALQDPRPLTGRHVLARGLNFHQRYNLQRYVEELGGTLHSTSLETIDSMHILPCGKTADLLILDCNLFNNNRAAIEAAASLCRNCSDTAIIFLVDKSFLRELATDPRALCDAFIRKPLDGATFKASVLSIAHDWITKKTTAQSDQPTQKEPSDQ